MKLNELVVTLCQKQCVATEIATATIYAASILLWMDTAKPKDNRPGQDRPAHEQPAPGCTGNARTLQFTRPL